MYRALRRAAQFSLAAGALCLAHPALAAPQTEPSGAEQRTSDAPRVGLSPVHPSQAQLEAMRVEMAWLADLIIFGYQLEIIPRTDALELRGVVPDEMVRQRALHVARQHSYMALLDHIQVVSPSGHAASVGSQDLQRLVIDHLLQIVGSQARTFEVKARADGQVILHGKIGSVEDKLTVSRALRHLSVCTAVHNELVVTPVLHAGQPVTLVTRNGSHMVRGALPQTPETLEAEMAATSKSPVNRVADVETGEPEVATSRPGATQAPIFLPPAPSVILPAGVPEGSRVILLNPPSQPSPAQVLGSPVSPSAGQPPLVIRPSVQPPPSGYLSPVYVPETVVSVTGNCQACGNPMELKPHVPLRCRLLDRITAHRATRPAQPTEAMQPTQIVQAVPAPPRRPQPQSPLVERPSVPTGAPANWPPAHNVRNSVGVEMAPAPAAGASIHPASLPASVVPLENTGTGRSAGGVTTASVEQEVFQSQPAETVPAAEGVGAGPTLATRSVDPGRLQRQVQAACGNLAKQVQVSPQRDHTLRVTIAVAIPGNEQKVVDRVLQIPEMSLPGVRLDIQVGP